MRFLFISNSKHHLYPSRDASTRYRCFNPAEDLRGLGMIADICTQRQFKNQYLDYYDIFIFHRPIHTRALERTVNQISRANKVALCDYDDLLFAPDLAASSPAYLSGKTSLKSVNKISKRYHRALKLFDFVTTSTTPLSEMVKQYNNNVHIETIHNGLSSSWVESAKACISTPPSNTVIGYFPGTKSHDHDFATVTQVLFAYFQTYPDARLLLVGSLDLRDASFPNDALILQAHVSYRRLPQWITRASVTLAPLEDTPFNQCKSGLKFFESAIFGVPVIASPIPDIARFKSSGILLAKTPEQFNAHLQQLEDREFYEQHQTSIKRYAERNCGSRQQTKRLLGFVRKHFTGLDALETLKVA